jgi:hypothetical protein
MELKVELEKLDLLLKSLILVVLYQILADIAQLHLQETVV